MTTAISSDAFITTLALLGIVIVVAALLSGIVERTGFPQVVVFLALGVVLGPAGLGLLDVTLDSPALRVAATLSLVLVLFTDAATLNVSQVRRHGVLAVLSLGPGTLLTAALISVLAWALLGLSPPAAAILGAALASTDPVLLRNLLSRRDLPVAARDSLRVESGLNDLVLLPIIVLAMTQLGQGGAGTDADWLRAGVSLFLLGPGAGVAVGLLSIGALDLLRRKVTIRRDYESLYALGIAFTAYAAAESVHGSGFLAAFAAGFVIATLDVELCDCFVEYGQTTAEMALLITFVLLGGSLIWSGFGVLAGATVLFAVATLILRPVVYLAVLSRVSIPSTARYLIAWFGPRGLSSLLLVLVPVFAGAPGSEQIFAICSLVVLCSLVLHGGTPMLMTARARHRPPDGGSGGTPPEPIASELDGGRSSGGGAGRMVAASRPRADGAASEPGESEAPASGLMAIEDARLLAERGEPLILLDVRTESSYHQSARQAAGAIRMVPDHVVERARELGLPPAAWIAAYCT